MKTDKFTKIVLAVIAVNLTIITVKDLGIIPETYANKSVKNVRFTPDINYGLVPLNEDGSINVKLVAGDVVDVQIRGINEASHLYWEAIKVKIVD